ncbi:hypothetical protein CHS0354_036708 [Potamilus streckersoni]|uniref:NAD(P)H oxidase (H(2)O(2)-forming) n=1 Tax=Potamilus streckersoni TaxID=2493646 RepID=A0AAE0TCW1_9BIVA|nr:hypothetical protein CHS0354_036708 [Potamilus streckersoni]
MHAVAFGVLILMAKNRQRKTQVARRRPPKKDDDPNTFLVTEWVGPKEGERNIKIKFDSVRKKIHATDRINKPLRMIDLRRTTGKVHVRLSDDSQRTLMSVRVPGEIDLVLRFGDEGYRDEFVRKLEEFLQKLGINFESHTFSEPMIMKDAETKESRKKLLDKFFRVVCLQVFRQSHDEINLHLDSTLANQIVKIKLTRTEFADALGLKPNSVFVRNMFLMVDKDKTGFVSFQEFMDMFVILARGNASEKAKLLFNMNDVRGRGYLTKADFGKMIKSMLDLSDSSLREDQVNQLIDSLYSQSGLRDTDNMNFDIFKHIFASDEYERIFENATLMLDATLARRSQVTILTKQHKAPQTKFEKRWFAFIRWVENYRRQIFWVTLYVLVTLGIFVERAHYYSFEREHAGLRRIAGYGVTVTRGAASVMMWTFSSLLLTMSRNTVTFLRETFLHRFIPFDSIHTMHKLIALIALIFTDVTGLTFKRPLNFEYRSGQWVRIACHELGDNEYHPFTLTSSPHEEHLSLHIRAVGPWTTNLRKTYDINNRGDKPLPMLYLDGPFGEGHQDWYRYRVSVLVGGGIGVTPFASILKDIVHKSKTGTKFPCEKVYFLWVTRTQKQFEWLTDIIREVETTDHRNLVSTHIFITQFQQKYDLRTTMLVKQIGVFSCGPPPMTLTVEKACSEVKQYDGFPLYCHHFENF